MRDESFFIGWEAKGPPETMSFIRRRVLLALLLVVAAGAGLAALQPGFASSNFEFGVVRSFEGTLEHHPFPVLAVERPGAESRSPAASRWLMTVFGKRGADPYTRSLDGHRVKVDGSLIFRDQQTMIEILPETLEDLGAPVSGGVGLPGDEASAGGERVLLQGEIVDSKCFLGVMKPGNLKTHRACAARCISGGVPPVLLVRDGEGVATYYLLVGAEGEAVNDAVLPFVAEPVVVEGELRVVGDLRILRADPAQIRRPK